MDFILNKNLNVIKKATSLSIKEFSDIIHKYTLYESIGEIQYVLNDINRGLFNNNDFDILINFNNDIPVACLIRLRHRLMCYVKKEFRNQNIGRSLVSIFKNEKSYAFKGFDDSHLFWKKMNITCI